MHLDERLELDHVVVLVLDANLRSQVLTYTIQELLGDSVHLVAGAFDLSVLANLDRDTLDAY